MKTTKTEESKINMSIAKINIKRQGPYKLLLNIP